MGPSIPFVKMEKIWYELTGCTSMEYKNKIVKDLLRNPDLSIYKNGIGVSALTVYDMEKNKFLYVDKDIEKVTGIALEHYFTKGPRYIFTKASLGHMPNLISSTIRQKAFFKNKPIEFYERYIVNRELAYRCSKTSQRWVLHQILQHLFNEKGELFGVVTMQTTLNHINHFGKFRFYIYDKIKNEIIYPEKHKKVLLSEREHQIIRLVLKEKSSAEIAEILHLSYHTVRTHRKNIMRKLNCHSVVELADEYKKL